MHFYLHTPVMNQVSPYGISLVGPTLPQDVVLSMTETVGIPWMHVREAGAIATDVALILPGAGISREAVQSAATKGAVIITFDESHLPANAQTIKFPYGVTGGEEQCAFKSAVCGEGWVIVLDNTLERMLDADGAWHAIGYNGEPAALVPCTRLFKGNMQRYWMDVMRYAFGLKHLPLIFRWFYPEGARSHFTVRIDADWYDETQWNATCDFLAPLKGKASWFLTCMDLAKDGEQKVKRLKDEGYEVGSHGFIHYTFKDAPNNAVNIRIAHEMLTKTGINVTSFVSPSAKWSRGLQNVIEKAGYPYSSEFGFAHDAYPLRPLGMRGLSSSLQVPIHPVSPGNFAKYTKATREEIVRYFRRTMHHLYNACLPMHMYGHPADLPLLAGNGMLEELLALPHTSVSTLAQYATWWQKRTVPFALSYVRANGSVQVKAHQSEFPLCVSWEPLKFYVSPHTSAELTLTRDHVPGAALFEASYADAPVFRQIERALNLRSKVGEWFDYEGLMPGKHFVVSSPRTALNALVKRMRGL